MEQSVDVRNFSVGSGEEPLLTLGRIASTDPRFRWVANLLDEEPIRRLSVADMIEEHFHHPRSDQARKAELLDHLTEMLRDMNTLNLAQELFDIGAAVEKDSHLLSVMLRRLGWSGELWYTEQEASYALGMSISQVRSTRSKFVRHFRRGPVWAPVLRRCAATAQHIGPITATQFRTAFGIEQDGPWSMHLWGVLVALDLFSIDHRFHLESTRTEPTLVSDSHVDFGFSREEMDYWAEVAEVRISKAIVQERRRQREERRERERFVDLWDVTVRRPSKRTDVGVSEREHLHYSDIPRQSLIWEDVTFSPFRFGMELRNLDWNEIPDAGPSRIAQALDDAAISPSFIDSAGVDLPPLTSNNGQNSIQKCSEQMFPPHPSLWSEVDIVTCTGAADLMKKEIEVAPEYETNAAEPEAEDVPLWDEVEVSTEEIVPGLVSNIEEDEVSVDSAEVDNIDAGDYQFVEDDIHDEITANLCDESLIVDHDFEAQPEVTPAEATLINEDSIPMPTDFEPASEVGNPLASDVLKVDEEGDSLLLPEISVESEEIDSIGSIGAGGGDVESSVDPGDDNALLNWEPSATEPPKVENESPPSTVAPSEQDEMEEVAAPAVAAPVKSQAEITTSAAHAEVINRPLASDSQESRDREQRSGLSRFWGAIANLFRRS